MKKYKLLKDLPGLSAGTIIGYNECEQKIYVLDNIIYTDNLAAILKDIFRYNYTGWLEEIEEAPKSIYELKNRGTYFYINDRGEIIKVDGLLGSGFEGRLEIGNVFLTEEEAEKELKKIKALSRIKRWIYENNIKTKEKKEIKRSMYECPPTRHIEIEGWVIAKDYTNNTLRVERFNSRYQVSFNLIIFTNKADAKKCWVECKKDWEILFDLK